MAELHCLRHKETCHGMHGVLALWSAKTMNRIGIFLVIGTALALLTGAPTANAAEPVKLSVFAAGTLAVPFRQIDALFEQKYPGVVVQPQFGGSVKMAKLITELHQPADVL